MWQHEETGVTTEMKQRPSKRWNKIGGVMSERDEALKEASETPLVDLLEKVLFESYAPGIHDDVLLERVRKSEDTITKLERELLAARR